LFFNEYDGIKNIKLFLRTVWHTPVVTDNATQQTTQQTRHNRQNVRQKRQKLENDKQ